MARMECGHTVSNDDDAGILAKGRRKTSRLKQEIELEKKPQHQQIVEMNNVLDLKQKTETHWR